MWKVVIQIMFPIIIIFFYIKTTICKKKTKYNIKLWSLLRVLRKKST